MNRSHHASQPLTSIEFEILLSLASGDRHGYAILQDIDSRTAEQLALRPGTLYRALSRLLQGGWVVERAAAAAAKEDARRRVYHLTPEGRRLATREATRLAQQLVTAKTRNVFRKA